jgi:hypothetical protein
MSLDIKVPSESPKKDWQESLYNVLLLWEDGSDTYDPLEMIIKDYPVTLASYALKHDFLGCPGWKSLNPLLPNCTANNVLLVQIFLLKS